MARDFEDIQGESEDVDAVTFPDMSMGKGYFLRVRSYDLNPWTCRHEVSNAADMIGVMMSNQDRNKREVMLVENCQHRSRLSGIHNGDLL